jgi:N-acetylmuramic acid 6-phosphate etherase
MISSAVMIKTGRVEGNKMIDMQLSNDKLVNRATKMVMDSIKVNKNEAIELLNKHKSVRSAIKNYMK